MKYAYVTLPLVINSLNKQTSISLLEKGSEFWHVEDPEYSAYVILITGRTSFTSSIKTEQRHQVTKSSVLLTCYIISMKSPRGIYSQIWYFVFDGYYDFTCKSFKIGTKGPDEMLVRHIKLCHIFAMKNQEIYSIYGNIRYVIYRILYTGKRIKRNRNHFRKLKP